MILRLRDHKLEGVAPIGNGSLANSLLLAFDEEQETADGTNEYFGIVAVVDWGKR